MDDDGSISLEYIYKNSVALRTLSRETFVRCEGYNMLCGHESDLVHLEDIHGQQTHNFDFKRETLLTFRIRLPKRCDASCKLYIWRTDDTWKNTLVSAIIN